MLILTVYRAILLGTTAVSSKATGGVHIGQIPQGAVRPNVLLRVSGSGQDMSHSGPVGLIDAEIIVTARGDTVQAAAELGEAMRDALTGWRGALYGCSVQLTEPMGDQSNYDDGAKVYEHILTFTSFYSKV